MGYFYEGRMRNSAICYLLFLSIAFYSKCVCKKSLSDVSACATYVKNEFLHLVDNKSLCTAEETLLSQRVVFKHINGY